jgi:hypothetical protein
VLIDSVLCQGRAAARIRLNDDLDLSTWTVHIREGWEKNGQVQ